VPTYSYACTDCGNRFDVVQAFTDDALTTCEECSGRLRKLFNSVGVVFKGSGFYRTDSRESAKSSTNGSAKTSSSSGNEGSSSSDKSGSSEKSSSSSEKSDSASSKSATAAAS
jgi:putative FmdB family regulatory protein